VSDRDAFRAEQQTRRQFGKAKQHEKRLENATYTAAEVKVLTEAALRLGRQEAAEEIAAAIDLKRDQRSYHETVGEWSEVSHGGVLLGLKEAAQIARSLPPLPQNAASDATSVPSEGPGTSEPSKAVKTPPKLVCRRCNGYGLIIVGEPGRQIPCADCALPARGTDPS
jgi:hypothetical protein